MDANGTRHFLFLGWPDWARCYSGTGVRLDKVLQTVGTDVEPQTDLPGWDPQRSELILSPRILKLRSTGPATLHYPQGAAFDRFGNCYFVEPDQPKLRVVSAGSGRVSDFWLPPGSDTARRPGDADGSFADADPQPAMQTPRVLGLSGLVVTQDHYLIVGTQQPAGLLIFDLFKGGAPSQWQFPEKYQSGKTGNGYYLTASQSGGAWILDRDRKLVWQLDRLFHFVPPAGKSLDLLSGATADDFQPPGTPNPTRLSPPQLFAPPITLDATDPTALAELGPSDILILDRDPGSQKTSIIRYVNGQKVLPVLSASIKLLLADPAAADLLGYDLVYVPGASADTTPGDLGRLYISPGSGAQCFVFRVSLVGSALHLEPLPVILPMSRAAGRGLAVSGGQVYYDTSFAQTDRNPWVPLLQKQHPRYVERATILTESLDSGQPGCTWHRVFVDACLPPETTIEVYSRSRETPFPSPPTDIPPLGSPYDPELDWQREPAFCQQADGSEQPFAKTPTGAHSGTFELLLQNARGRYAQLKLRLVGPGVATPRLRALRIYFPRFSYLHEYLPTVYQDGDLEPNPEPGLPNRFLERYLANLEGIFTTVEDRIAAAHVLLDARSAPAEALDWLASFFGVALDPAWDEDRRRLFIRHAREFFRARGTKRGLTMALRLAFDKTHDPRSFDDVALDQSCIRIVESFRTRLLPAVLLGDPLLQPTARPATVAARWRPEQGIAALLMAYRKELHDFTQTPETELLPPLPLTAPSEPQLRSFWEGFCAEYLGFVPAASASDASRWEVFLRRRYRDLDALRNEYGANLADFFAVPLPTQLRPEQRPETVTDWYLFEAVVLASQRLAHRFTVLIPWRAPVHEEDGGGYLEERRLAERIIFLEKPAHVVFDVKFYFNMFQIGSARLGIDSLIDLGSRAPALLTRMVLGVSHLAESYLANPSDKTGRYVVSHEPLSI